jgi:hypothetical protein
LPRGPLASASMVGMSSWLTSMGIFRFVEIIFTVRYS